MCEYSAEGKKIYCLISVPNIVKSWRFQYFYNSDGLPFRIMEWKGYHSEITVKHLAAYKLETLVSSLDSNFYINTIEDRVYDSAARLRMSVRVNFTYRQNLQGLFYYNAIVYNYSPGRIREDFYGGATLRPIYFDTAIKIADWWSGYTLYELDKAGRYSKAISIRPDSSKTFEYYTGGVLDSSLSYSSDWQQLSASYYPRKGKTYGYIRKDERGQIVEWSEVDSANKDEPVIITRNSEGLITHKQVKLTNGYRKEFRYEYRDRKLDYYIETTRWCKKGRVHTSVIQRNSEGKRIKKGY